MIAWWVTIIVGVAGAYLGGITVAAFVVGTRSRYDAWPAETYSEIRQLPEVPS